MGYRCNGIQVWKYLRPVSYTHLDVYKRQMYASVSYEGKDIKELSSFTEQTVKPYLERQAGVASVSANGLIQDRCV